MTKLPKSSTSIMINFMGVIGLFFSLYYIRVNQIPALQGAFIVLLSIVLPIVLLETIFLKTYKRESTGLNFKKKNKLDLNRVIIKLLGLYLSLALVGAIYFFVPVYRSDFYNIYWDFLKVIVPIILIGSIPYFLFMDMYLKEPEESYYNAGLVLLGKWKQVDNADFKNHFLGWLIKAFFLPIMIEGLTNNINYFKGGFIVNWFNNFTEFFNITNTLLFTIDLAFVSMGYMMSLRIFDSHIRTAEPTFYGWGVALLCYPPFNENLTGMYTNYEDGYKWIEWLSGNQTLYIIWGTVILLLVSVYVWATIPFGIRFSNLTHRGILTNGPYRFMKHPAYVSKNLSWWMISIPFISHISFWEAVARCLALLTLNFIYFNRARTEENHLSKDPVYIEYASYVNENGIFKWLFNSIPYFKYKPEKYNKLEKGENMQKNNYYKS